jgi:hypothetical protein
MVVQWDRLLGQARPEIWTPDGVDPRKRESDLARVQELLRLGRENPNIVASMEQLYVTTVSGIATATTAKTILELTPPTAANGVGPTTILETWVEFNAAAFGQPLLVEFLRVTATTGITGTTVTPVKYSELTNPATAIVTKHTASAEGTITVTENIALHYVAPTGGIYIQFPLGREPDIISGTNRYFRIRVTGSSGVTPSCSFGLVFKAA